MAYRTLDHSDMNLFKNRLWKLMENKGIYTAEGLAKNLYDNHYVSVKQKESYDDPSIIYHRAIDSVKNKVQRHLNSNTAKKLQGEYAIAYCKFFDCSADYLFGNIECRTHDNQFIQNETGLSEPAIEELRLLALFDSTLGTEPDLNTINILLQQLSSKYNNIIHTITSYLRSNGLSEDSWYDIRSEKLSEKKPAMNTDRVHIPAHSDIFDNLLLMDIEKRIINLKNELKKAPNAN